MCRGCAALHFSPRPAAGTLRGRWFSQISSLFHSATCQVGISWCSSSLCSRVVLVAFHSNVLLPQQLRTHERTARLVHHNTHFTLTDPPSSTRETASQSFVRRRYTGRFSASKAARRFDKKCKFCLLQEPQSPILDNRKHKTTLDLG